MKKFFTSFAVILLLIFGAFLFLTSNFISGVQAFIVKSGSMEPAIPAGALVITKQTKPNLLKSGDVITFVEPWQSRQQFVTHRISEVSSSYFFSTKGDNNRYSDNWQVTGDAVIGKVTFSMPYAGSLLTFTQSNAGMFFFIFMPAAYVIIGQTNVIRKEIQS